MTLKELRMNAGLDIYQTARKVGVSYSAVWNWENGVNGILKKYQKKLARLYGLSVDELLEVVNGNGETNG